MQCGISNIETPVYRAIEKYQSYLSIEKRKETSGNESIFSFVLVSIDTIFKEAVYPDFNKANTLMMYQLTLLKQVLIYQQFTYLKLQ